MWDSLKFHPWVKYFGLISLLENSIKWKAIFDWKSDLLFNFNPNRRKSKEKSLAAPTMDLLCCIYIKILFSPLKCFELLQFHRPILFNARPTFNADDDNGIKLYQVKMICGRSTTTKSNKVQLHWMCLCAHSYNNVENSCENRIAVL